jgi:putative transposase
MSDYRRWFVAGGSYFFTIVTRDRLPLFGKPSNIALLRDSIRFVKEELPFAFEAAVALPDHMHFIWTLPRGDFDYPKRIGRMKARFTKLWRAECGVRTFDSGRSSSRRKHRESNLWQRRFWEHTIQSESEFEALLDYIHYNPVKHGYAACPHAWETSSFHKWVERSVYERQWACQCKGRVAEPLDFKTIETFVSE